MKVGSDPQRARMHRLERRWVSRYEWAVEESKSISRYEAYRLHALRVSESYRSRKNYYIPDPITGEVRYIGSVSKDKAIETRLKEHISAAQPPPFTRWMMGVLERGLEVEIIGWDEPLLEADLINECSKHGDLLNVTYNARTPQRVYEHAIHAYYNDLAASISGGWKG